MIVSGISAMVFIAIAGCFGLLRVGSRMTMAVLTLAVGAPLGFMVFDAISLFIPLGAYLGALPAFVIAAREKQERLGSAAL